MMDAFQQGVQLGSIEFKGSRKGQLQSRMLLEMLKIDPEGANKIMKAWARFAELSSGRQHHIQFATLEEYIPHRLIDVGQM